MKRIAVSIAVLALVVFAAACATTPATPNVRGVISQMNGNALTVTPAGGGTPVTVNTTWSTRVYWQNGIEATRADLTTGQAVQVYLAEGTQNAARVNIAQ